MPDQFRYLEVAGALAVGQFTDDQIHPEVLTTCGSATSAQVSAGSMSCDLSSLPNGTYYIKAGAFDNANNNKTINSGNFVISR